MRHSDSDCCSFFFRVECRVAAAWRTRDFPVPFPLGYSTCKEENDEDTVAQVPFFLSAQPHKIVSQA